MFRNDDLLVNIIFVICTIYYVFFLCHFRCSKEMNQWESLLEYANSRGNVIPELILECAWRVPNWPLMKDALGRVIIFVFYYQYMIVNK